ncbi:MAG: prenyltransferase/squalene oxidase repeat-containing protein [Saprospiraceae bacterium]|nr:prenyltransferase/squalene oxidase repeat-containing protein [Saprospiraceae bacterium]
MAVRRSWWWRKVLYPCLAWLVLAGCSDPAQPAVMEGACAYLWAMQGSDGGWHSATHGILKEGAAITPFIVWHLLAADEAPPHGAPERALDFIRNTLAERTGQEIMDYPNYAAAYALRVLHQYGEPADSGRIRVLVDELVAQQFVASRGMDRDHPAYGGWGFGETGLAPGQAGHVDLSHTRRVLQALSAVLPAEHPAFAEAIVYLKRHQNLPPEADSGVYADGGFFTSMHTAYTNKSRQYTDIPPRWESYATATADGLLGLLAVPENQQHRIAAAVQWLQQHDALEYVEGIPQDDPAQWHLVMQYYHLAVRAEALANAGVGGAWQQAVQTMLLQAQRPDGSFANPLGGPNKEDDPLLATAFAVTALSYAGSL